jgi:hypothetical protein
VATEAAWLNGLVNGKRLMLLFIGAIWSNAKRRQGFYVVEEYGRPVGTRTPDLYRVKQEQVLQ